MCMYVSKKDSLADLRKEFVCQNNRQTKGRMCQGLRVVGEGNYFLKKKTQYVCKMFG